MQIQISSHARNKVKNLVSRHYTKTLSGAFHYIRRDPSYSMIADFPLLFMCFECLCEVGRITSKSKIYYVMRSSQELKYLGRSEKSALVNYMYHVQSHIIGNSLGTLSRAKTVTNTLKLQKGKKYAK